MKNRIFFLLLACFFMTINSAFVALDGGIVLPIVNGKSGTELCTFTVPQKYLDEKGMLIHPLEVVIKNTNNKMPVYSEYSDDLIISLPDNLSGTYFIAIKMGDMIAYKKIQV